MRIVSVRSRCGSWMVRPSTRDPGGRLDLEVDFAPPLPIMLWRNVSRLLTHAGPLIRAGAVRLGSAVLRRRRSEIYGEARSLPSRLADRGATPINIRPTTRSIHTVTFAPAKTRPPALHRTNEDATTCARSVMGAATRHGPDRPRQRAAMPSSHQLVRPDPPSSAHHVLARSYSAWKCRAHWTQSFSFAHV
jgi:hypothetical protein